MKRKQKGEVVVGVVLLVILFLTIVDPHRMDCQKLKGTPQECPAYPAAK